MRDATKKVAKKSAAKKAPAKKAVAKKAAVPDVLGAARESLGAIAAQEETVNVKSIVFAVLANITGLVKIDPETGDVTPFGLLSLAFNDNQVGLSDEQMPGFYSALSVAIGIPTVAAFIAQNLASNPTASAHIRDVVKAVQSSVNSAGDNQ